MKKSWSLVALVPALALLVPARAVPSTVGECQAAIRTLSLLTEDVLFLRGTQGLNAQRQLLSHLAKASTQLDRVDLRDALKQMDAYSTDLSRAVAAAKIGSDNAAALQIGANAVIVCITAIGN